MFTVKIRDERSAVFKLELMNYICHISPLPQLQFVIELRPILLTHNKMRIEFYA